MENAEWRLLAFLTVLELFLASSQDMLNWVNIDCGAETLRTGNNLIVWDMDKPYTKAGRNKRVSQSQAVLEEMNTLRIFPNKLEENCYRVPVYALNLRYLVRTGFYYGNYDHRSKPPTFDLQIDGKKWITVNTSSSDGGGLIYHEIMYMTHGSGCLELCLVLQGPDDEENIPFISSIEVVPLWVNLYPHLQANATFHLVARTNFGGNEIRLTGLLSDEKYNRIWTRGATPSGCVNVKTLTDPDSDIENHPPLAVLSDSIQSNSSGPIILTVDLPLGNWQLLYFVFYQAEYSWAPSRTNHSWILHIKVGDDGPQKVAAPDHHGGKSCKVVNVDAVMVAGPTVITVTISPADNLPPLLAAMEVFAIDNTTSEPYRRPKHSNSGLMLRPLFLAYVLVHIMTSVLVLLA